MERNHIVSMAVGARPIPANIIGSNAVGRAVKSRPKQKKITLRQLKLKVGTKVTCTPQSRRYNTQTGTVTRDGKIKQDGQDGKKVTLIQFAEPAGYGISQRNPKKLFYKEHVYFEVGRNVLQTFQQLCENHESKSRQDEMREELKKANIASLQPLMSIIKNRMGADFPRFVYRTCRDDEIEEENIGSSSGITTYKPLRPNVSTGQPSYEDYKKLEPTLFIKDLNDHIRNGSISNRRRLHFISTSADLDVVLWWSHWGLKDLVVIESEKCIEKNIQPIGVGLRQHENLTYDGIHRGYAAESREVTFAQEIPFGAYQKLNVTWKVEKRYLTNEQKAYKYYFPNEKQLQDCFNNGEIEIETEYFVASTNPCKINLTFNGRDWSEKHRTKSNRAFMMKKGGRKGLTHEHEAGEFFALVCYHNMDIKVPHGAFYEIVVTTRNPFNGEETRHFTNILLTEVIDGDQCEERDASRDIVKKSLLEGAAADIAIANFDVCGDDMSNLIIAKRNASDRTSSENSITVRVDVGNCFRFGPGGETSQGKNQATYSKSPEELFEDIKDFIHKKGNDSADQLRVSVFKQIASATLRNQAKNIISKLNFEKNIRSWFASTACKMPLPQWQTHFETLLQRIRLIAEFDKPPSMGNGQFFSGNYLDSTPVPAIRESSSKPLKQIKILSTRATAKQKLYKQNGYEIIDVTSKSSSSKWRQFSPFYSFSRPLKVPGMKKVKSCTVEGIWQGLKTFELEDGSFEDIDVSKFQIKNMKGLKRTLRGKSNDNKKRKRVIGHKLGNDIIEGADGENGARKKIYIPLYQKVLKERLNTLVEDLREKATNKKIALLDYLTNGDYMVNKPLSHAALLKQYIIDTHEDKTYDDFDELVDKLSPSTTKKRVRSDAEGSSSKTTKKPSKKKSKRQLAPLLIQRSTSYNTPCRFADQGCIETFHSTSTERYLTHYFQCPKNPNPEALNRQNSVGSSNSSSSNSNEVLL
eukprot:g7547.t1